MVVIQIGANRGYDDFTALIKDRYITKLILVEPLSAHNQKLHECYSYINNKVIVNSLITDSNKNEECIYIHKQDGFEFNNNYELASTNYNHAKNIRPYYEEIDIIKISCKNMTANTLFDEFKLKDIDILFIDTEGCDSKIIKSIDFKKFNIKELYYENLHIDANDLRCFLRDKGFKITEKVFNFGWTDKAVKM